MMEYLIFSQKQTLNVLRDHEDAVIKKHQMMKDRHAQEWYESQNLIK